MADQFVHSPAIAKHFGTWEGESVKIDPQGNVLDKHATKIEIGAKGKKYSQRNTYTWPDGKTKTIICPGEFESSGKLIVQMPNNIRGAELTVINDNQLIFVAPSVPVFEAINMCPDQKTRYRTVQVGDINGTTSTNYSVTETHTSKEDVYFEI